MVIDITPKRNFKQNERPVTIVLKHSHNERNGTRLVHTWWCEELLDGSYVANNDDRTSHSPDYHGITWITGHVAFDSPEALKMLRDEAKFRETVEIGS